MRRRPPRKPQGGRLRIEEAYSTGYARGVEIGQYGGTEPVVPWRYDVPKNVGTEYIYNIKGMGTPETRAAYIRGYQSGVRAAKRGTK